MTGHFFSSRYPAFHLRSVTLPPLEEMVRTELTLIVPTYHYPDYFLLYYRIHSLRSRLVREVGD